MKGNKMKAAKRKRLERAGWKFGDASEFLAMTPEEKKYVELKLHLADVLENRRKAEGLTQKALAERLKSSQSRVAFMEKGVSVSVDLILRALFALGMSQKEVAKQIAVAG